MSAILREVRGTGTNDAASLRDAWDRLAGGYDRFVTDTQFWIAEQGLRLAGLKPGNRFLDVAAGTGALSIPAARLGAKVLATDLAPEMLRQLAARARRTGLRVETRAMDGHALTLEDDSFDLSGSQFGVMLFPDMPRGVREMARVTRSGGRVLMIVFGNPAEVEFLQFFIRAARTAIPDFQGLPSDPPPLSFQLRDPAKLKQVLAGAGLKQVRVETLTKEMTFETGDQLWNWLASSNPIGAALTGGMTRSQQPVVRAALEKLIRSRASGSGRAVLTNPVNIGVGTKP